MRAGLLKEILDFQEKVKTKMPSGATREEFVSILTTRAAKKKLTAVVNQDGVNASEQFIGNLIVFQVRYNPLIKANQQVIYRGESYSIQLLDHQSDNTYIVTLKKINL